MKGIEEIIYHTTRGIFGVEDKLSIATIFLFCNKIGSKSFAELLYSDSQESFIDKLGEEYLEYGVDFSIRFDNKNVSDCFYKTLEKVIEKYDSDGYYKALFHKDEFALVIDDIVNTQFDNIQKINIAQTVSQQLSFLF